MLDDAISYLKLLQLRANILDEQKKNLRVEKAWVFGDNDIGESSSSVYLSTRALPEIKAKVQGKDVLIRVHCENKNGYLTKVLREIEKLQLVVENISSLPFGDYFLDIAVTAKVIYLHKMFRFAFANDMTIDINEKRYKLMRCYVTARFVSYYEIIPTMYTIRHYNKSIKDR